MTPAELKTIRESLGLSAQWLADQAGVQLRTIRYWESGLSPTRSVIPDDVAALVLQLDEQINIVVGQSLAQLGEMRTAHGGAPACVTLIRYRSDEDLWRFRPDMKPTPVGYHAAILARLRTAIEARGIDTEIIFMEPDAYLEWLGKRADSEAMRLTWATLISN